MSRQWKKSIKHHLLMWLLVPLLTLALVSTVASYFLGLALARGIYDKQLSNSADSVIARIKTNGDKLTVDLPPAALAILKHNYQDDFYFQVISPDGKVISGDKLLPVPSNLIDNASGAAIPTEASPQAIVSKDEDEPIFRTIEFKGRELRVVTQKVPTPDSIFGHVFIQAAETRNTRKELANQISISIFLAQMAIIICGAAAVWIGVGRGLRPLAKVEMAVQARAAGDLSPLNADEPVEIISLITALNRLFKQLENDLELQKRFTSNAAHQLRTPLAVVTTYCDLARKMVKEPDVQDVLAELEAAINRMSRLVNRLLVLARSEPGAAIERPLVQIELSAVASEVTAAHVPEAIRKKIEFEFLAPSEPAVVYGDRNGLEELISNLVENSILYSDPGGKIKVIVQTVHDANKILLTVEDSGCGIPEHEREKVFERFYRGAGTDKPGTGLGLAIVREVAIAHGAEVQIKSGSNGRGTAIVVSFPGNGHESRKS
ncbi:MAG: sensor histidine kinase [Cyanobacteria bacterium SZAS TMP-1]|nr:sensor histidine kinase [Cyanobacteria bacterium SZAS TMP-1]